MLREPLKIHVAAINQLVLIKFKGFFVNATKG